MYKNTISQGEPKKRTRTSIVPSSLYNTKIKIMQFTDEAKILIKSGDGGAGCVSFRREKYVERGGPDGGDGGSGGDVKIVSSSKEKCLYQYKRKKKIFAQNGKSGAGKNRYGKSGEDITIFVPIGTLVTNDETGEIVYDFTKDNEVITVLKGGKGGLGNKHFTTSTNKAPRFAQEGIKGNFLTLKLELKLIADVGIVGLPNAGKSTLISMISAAKPKIANYPFTTLTPNIGIVENPTGYDPFSVADIPGLIEGAHKNIGLGHSFLKHIERTKILLHIVDASSIDETNPLENFQIINNELGLYEKKILEKKQVIALNKIDLPEGKRLANIFIKAINKENKKIFLISAATKKGIDKLVEELSMLIDEESKK